MIASHSVSSCLFVNAFCEAAQSSSSWLSLKLYKVKKLTVISVCMYTYILSPLTWLISHQTDLSRMKGVNLFRDI